MHSILVDVQLPMAALVPSEAGGLFRARLLLYLRRTVIAVALPLQDAYVGGPVVTMQTGEKDEARLGQMLGDALLSTDQTAAQRFGPVAGGALVRSEGTAWTAGATRPRVHDV